MYACPVLESLFVAICEQMSMRIAVARSTRRANVTPKHGLKPRQALWAEISSTDLLLLKSPEQMLVCSCCGQSLSQSGSNILTMDQLVLKSAWQMPVCSCLVSSQARVAKSQRVPSCWPQARPGLPCWQDHV